MFYLPRIFFVILYSKVSERQVNKKYIVMDTDTSEVLTEQIQIITFSWDEKTFVERHT